jgi:phosphatidylserine/phosphatidylglycerophosphate/cardiolipin synthase-like enzyme
MRRRWLLLPVLLALLCLSLFAGPIGAQQVQAWPPTPSGSALYLPVISNVGGVQLQARAQFSAFIPDGLALQDADEGFEIQNLGPGALFLGGWQVGDGEGLVRLPDLVLSPGQRVWCARQAQAFKMLWGQNPACEYQRNTDDTVPDATGTAPSLKNDGDELVLYTPSGQMADAVVYKKGDVSIQGWLGPALQAYHPSNSFASEGQVFYRLFQPGSGLPAVPDSDTLEDWAQGNGNPLKGRRAAYPGWELHRLGQAAGVTWTQPHNAKVLVAPDNTFLAILGLLASAHQSIFIEAYEINHPDLIGLLARRARAGVDVRVLLEGGPVGGLTDETRWAAQQLSEAGAQVYFMVNDVGTAHDRYPYQHSKFIIVDNKMLLVSTENFKTSSLPVDVADGETLGRRGYAIILEDRVLVARARLIFTLDANPAMPDIFPWQAEHDTYGAPPPGYQPPAPPNLQGYPVQFPTPLQATDATAAQLFTAPETTLYPSPLLALIARAGPGDALFTQQLYEHPYWGANTSNAQDDPNVRLEALIDAARRGAKVRILLDGFFDAPYQARSNLNTVNALNAVAQAEHLDLVARRGNPTGAGLHAKLHLLALGDDRWVVVSSVNGSEASNKLNREMGLALESAQAYTYLKHVFDNDWQQNLTHLSLPLAWQHPD